MGRIGNEEYTFSNSTKSLYDKSDLALNIVNILQLSLTPSHVMVATTSPSLVKCFMTWQTNGYISAFLAFAAVNC